MSFHGLAVLPFCYFFATRQKSLKERIAWVAIQPLPAAIIVAFYSDGAVAADLLIATLGLCAWQAVYEIGYIHNDVFTTRSETSPTLRLAPRIMDWFAAHMRWIVACRLAIFVAMLAAITAIALATDSQPHMAVFVLIVLVAQGAFQLHNRVRSRVNVLSYAMLASCRYTVVSLLVVPAVSLAPVAALCLLLMPVPRIIEHACKPKYGLRGLAQFVGAFDRFRVIYYAALVGTLLVAWLLLEPVAWLWPALAGYFLLYRLFVAVALRKRLVAPTRHAAYESADESI